MRRIFLFRHADPCFPEGERCCLGQNMDPPLSEAGRAEAASLAGGFQLLGVTAVFSSPLRRAVDTAALLCGDADAVKPVPGFTELGCGEWEGHTFGEIRTRWPELWEARQNDMSLPPPGGETFDSAADRALASLRACLAETEGDIAVVAHAGVNRAILCAVTGTPMCRNREFSQNYACVNVLEEENGILRAAVIGRNSTDLPDPDAMYAFYGTPAHIHAHCIGVRDMSLRMAANLIDAGYPIDLPLLSAGAELHDICRLQPRHGHVGGREMARRGYLRTGDVIAGHISSKPDAPLDERFIVFLADKLVMETREVTVEERYAASAHYCTNEEMVAAHGRSLAEAQCAWRRYLEAIHAKEIPSK